MAPVSLVALVVGSLCVAVGAVTVLAPERAAAASRRVLPAVNADDQQWRAVGLVTAGVGLLLLTSV